MGVNRMWKGEQSYECYPPEAVHAMFGPAKEFGRAPLVDQSQIGGSLANVVVMGKVVLRYLNASVACG